MENRKYNIFFHLHTVSGIVISVVLFVIFFAGSFSFFRDDIDNWQRNESAEANEYLHIDFDKAISSLDSAYILKGRTFQLSRPHGEKAFIAHLDPTKDSLVDKKAREHQYAYVDPDTFKKETYEENYKLGEFLYRLHFLAQIPYPYGYYLAGFTALFFLFAIITGVLVHWKKIVSNFYTFRPKEKLKMLWTDSHTALGMIGLPFQFVYAVTGAFFLINIFLVAPSVMTFFGNDSEKLYQDLGFTNKPIEYAGKPLENPISLNALVKTAEMQFKDFRLTLIEVQNFGDVNMQVIADGTIPKDEKFTGFGRVVFDARGTVISKKDPRAATTYLDGTKNVLYKIHYGDYAGYGLKIVSFMLGLITCFVILSGVMLWLVARDKKKMDPKKKRFNETVVRIYLSISLTMFPITAATFIAVKLKPDSDMTSLYSFYFIGWLALATLFFLKKNLGFINKYCLLLGSIGGFAVPIVNGTVTGNWLWRSLPNGMFSIFFVDALWIVLSAISLYAFFRTRNTRNP